MKITKITLFQPFLGVKFTLFPIFSKTVIFSKKLSFFVVPNWVFAHHPVFSGEYIKERPFEGEPI